MSDQQKPEDRAPRSGAGDAARTQQIPRLGRDGKPVGSSSQADSQRTVADALREARQKPEASAKDTNGSTNRRPAGPARPASSSRSTPAAAKPAEKSTPRFAAKPEDTSTDAPRPPAAKTAAPAETAAPAKKAEPAKKVEPAKTAATRPATQATPDRKPAARQSTEKTPTAADYARTTRQSADSTAVIPAVRDESSSTTTASPAAAASSGRQARLRLTHVEPWSVTRLAFVVSVALMIVSVVAVTIFWVVLDLTGIWDQLNGTVTNVLSDSEGSFDLTDYLGLGRLVGLTLVFSAINVVLMTAIATIAAHLYNLAAQLLGGIEVTFTDN